MSSLSEQRMKGQANHGNNGSSIQYPTFSVKVGQWSNNAASSASASTSTNNSNKVVSNYGNNGDYNAWGGSSVNQGGNQYHSRSRQGQGGYDDYSNSSGYNNRGGYGGVNDGGRDGKHIERGMQGLGLGGGGRNPEQQQQKDSAPRKMTWASIASQPAKPTITQTSTILKKKGPGMPPPPMVPGRHNMDIMTWDSPAKNGPPLVPPTFNEPPQAPPPISTSPRNSESARYPQANGGGSGGSGPAWPTLQAGSMAAPPAVQQPPQQAPPPMQPERRPEPRSHNSYNSHQSHYERNEERGERSNQNHEGYSRGGHQMPPPSHQHHPSSYGSPPSSASAYSQPPSQPPVMSAEDQTEALNRLLDMSKYNPPNFEIENPHLARFFVIKSYSEDDIHRSIKYNIWCSTEHGNKRLDQAFHEREKEGGCVYLFYSVNASGHFCGMAQMISAVDYSSNSSVWAQDKWKGSFKVRWIFVKDVPNPQLRQIRLENNENKPITNSRDTQEVPNAKGIAVWRIISAFKHSTSLFDDFVHYELRQQEENTRRVEPAPQHQYRSGSPSQFDNKYQDRSNGGGHKYGGDRDGEQNNNPRGGGDMGSSSYDRNYRSGGYNNRNTYGNPNFERNSYQSGGNNGGGYNNRNYGGYRRDDQPRNQDGNDSGGGGPPSGSYHPRSGGNYRGSNNRGGFNNDYYNNRRPDNRDRGDRGDRGGYRPQSSSTDYTKE